MLPHRPSLLTTIMRARYPADELTHFVGLWGPHRGGKLTNTVGGLVYALTSPTRDLTGYRLVADGVTYTGPDSIRQWADANLPRSLEIAREIRRRHPDGTRALPAAPATADPQQQAVAS